VGLCGCGCVGAVVCVWGGGDPSVCTCPRVQSMLLGVITPISRQSGPLKMDHAYRDPIDIWMARTGGRAIHRLNPSGAIIFSRRRNSGTHLHFVAAAASAERQDEVQSKHHTSVSGTKEHVGRGQLNEGVTRFCAEIRKETTHVFSAGAGVWASLRSSLSMVAVAVGPLFHRDAPCGWQQGIDQETRFVVRRAIRLEYARSFGNAAPTWQHAR
jgi:hypothetical protein